MLSDLLLGVSNAVSLPTEKDINTGIFLAYSKATHSLYKSIDLLQWDTVSNGTLPLGIYDTTVGYSVAYGNGIYVAIDIDACKIYSSTDGVTWTLRYTQSGWRGYRVKFLNGKFIVIGNAFGNTGLTPMAVSTNGINWTTPGSTHISSNLNGKNVYLYDIEYIFNKYVLIGYREDYLLPFLATSINLTQFTRISCFDRQLSIANITADENIIYTAGNITFSSNNSQIVKSNDNTPSSMLSMRTSSSPLFSLIKNYNPTELLVADDVSVYKMNKTTAAYSLLHNGISPRTMMAGNGKLVIGCNANILFSNDGTNWNNIATPNGCSSLLFSKNN